MDKKKKSPVKMKKAMIDQVMMWLMIFVGFITTMFLVIDYSMINRVKANIDLLSEFGAKSIALEHTEEDIAEKLNTMKSGYFANINPEDINCVVVENNSYKISFTVIGEYTDTKILSKQSNIVSKKSVFYDNGTDQIDCTLNLIKQ